MMLDEEGHRLYTVASRGYPESGVGSEVELGDGVIGTVAKRRRPLRIASVGRELSYVRAVRDQALRVDQARVVRQIPLPGLPDVGSILAVPMVAGDALLGVVSVESAVQGAFDRALEHAVALLAAVTAGRLGLLDEDADRHHPTEGEPSSEQTVQGVPACTVTYYEDDCAVFVDHDYIIKSLPGRILWKLLRENAETGRTEFTNLELRHDAALGLPAYRDNLESRLLLLRRRLDERQCGFRIEKSGRGRFRLVVAARLALKRVSAPGVTDVRPGRALRGSR